MATALTFKPMGITVHTMTKPYAYYNELDPFAAEWTWRLIEAGHIAPSGRPYCQLAASVLHTNETGSGSWPTPAANEFELVDVERLEQRREECRQRLQNGNGFGLTLGQLAAVNAATWVSPASRDYKDTPGMSTTGPNGRNRVDQLPRQVHGLVPDGFPATMGKRASLNPAFSLWLMGYPSAWASCGAQVTPSSRKSRRSS